MFYLCHTTYYKRYLILKGLKLTNQNSFNFFSLPIFIEHISQYQICANDRIGICAVWWVSLFFIEILNLNSFRKMFLCRMYLRN